ncbi:peroxiredoxin [Serratia liquefaciens]|uniref:peroxiredoxin n=1 Tax=Serratia liquefaciens TaxID=614 RepID=UPI00301C8B80
MANKHHMGNPALLPDDLPCPVDDGAADHLVGMPMPALRFHSTFGERGDLSILPGRTVVYAYPRTGEPHGNLPAGWDAIPGARGCTAQTLSFQAEKEVFTTFGIRIFGLSTQTTDYQRELSHRLRLTFPILSDAEFALVDALRLPTMNVEGMRLIKRLTLIIRDGTIEHVFYPVFPANRAAAEVIGWLRDHPDLAPGTLD